MADSVAVTEIGESLGTDLRSVFVPNWLYLPRDDGVYISDDKDRRTPHPPSAPKHVVDFVASTYKAKSATPCHGSTSCQTFTLFPKLPSELRLEVWKFALPGSRVVEVLYNASNGRSCYSSCPPPIHLSVSYEARQVALERYKLSFATLMSPPIIYFDMEIDQIYIGAGNFLIAGEPAHAPTVFFNDLLKDRSSIKHLIIDEMFSEYFTNKEDDPYITERYGLPNLESLTLVADTDTGDVDTVICPAEKQQGEFQGWSFCTRGRATPYFLPEEKDSSTSDTDISLLWSDLEKILASNGSDPTCKLTLVRRVSRPRLKREHRWKARVAFLDGITYSARKPCVFLKDGVIDRLVEMADDEELNGSDTYEQFTRLLCEGLGDAHDPILIYAAIHPCVCSISHVGEPELPEDERPEIYDIITLDHFKTALAKLDASNAS
ncbi:hypothetical protein BKA61DRAFT_588202 [Leptodontidium sp. MPI-SDFR-AT-0119]|nr:hypothetical protein BKA61DRAFT_588202 [Leptodontidium sp. MPI-SDFR-AT-0119]